MSTSISPDSVYGSVTYDPVKTSRLSELEAEAEAPINHKALNKVL